MNKAPLDTDILPEITKGLDPSVVARESRHMFSRYTIPAVTIMEAMRGDQKKQAIRQLQTFLTATASEAILPFELAAAKLAGNIGGE